MSKFWSGVVAASFVVTVGLSAQEPAAPRGGGAPGGAGAPGAQAPAPAPQAGAAKSVTLNGCIQAAPAAGAAAASGPKFILASKAAPGAPAGGAVGTSGTGAMRYSLDGEEKTISSHLNQQVEVTGTVQPPAAGAAPGAGPTLKVESVKMVAATCS
jgi:hypothetical protein